MSTLKLTDCHHVLEAFDANLAASRFREVSLARAELEHATLEQARFKNVQLDGAQFEDCTFVGV